MKKIFSLILLIILVANNVGAQCSGCTANITGLDNNPYFISSGVTICVAPTGTMTGLITIDAGGTLCNQGKIQSTNLWVKGGTLKNYGTIDTYSVLVSTAGTFTNYSTALIDSLMITNPNSSYVNNGTQTGTAFTTADHATTVNSGTITVYDMWDTIASFYNTNKINVTHDFGNAYSSSFTNTGNLTVTNDMANTYTSTCTNNGNFSVTRDFYNTTSGNFTNSNYMNITRDFFNTTSANFTTKCMMQVSRNWYNTTSANVYGPATSCGGFSVTGTTGNSANIGSSTTHLDICDAGHPTFGLDGPGGTINGTTTYCSCANTCSVVSVGIKELVKESSILISTIYPNPSTNAVIIKLNSQELETLMVEVRDMMGKIIMTKSLKVSIGENETELNVTGLAQGTYILSITDSHQLQSKRLFSVSK